VPLIVIGHELTLVNNGELADLAPTVFELLGLRQPLQMTGKSLTNAR
jgi:2,3-bisphosphoglycerate-independent phosphoglycerate mutase